jgi:hypothetical protein
MVINASGAINITAISARLNGEITSTGGEDSTVHIYWGNNDGVTNPANWDTDINLGVRGAGAFYTDISGLTSGQTYYYRCVASNSAGSDWADSTSSFVAQNHVEILKLIGADDSTPTGMTSSNYFILDRFIATQTGTISDIRIKCGANGNVKVAVYDDTSSQPTSLLSAVNSSTPVSTGWNAITLNTPVSVTSGTAYWLAFIMDTPCVSYKQEGTNTRCFKPATYTGFTFPNSAGTSFTTNYTIWFDYLAGWGTSSPPTPPTPPDPPTIVSPGVTITFKWTASTGATKYHLQVNTQSDFLGMNMFNADVGDVTSYEVTGLSNGTTYHWRVKAGNNAGWSTWSSTTRSVLAN